MMLLVKSFENKKPLLNFYFNQIEISSMRKLIFFSVISSIIFVAGCSEKVDYVGDLRNGNPHGKGTLTYENGGVYEGEWKEGKREGKGIMTFEDGGKYEGEWKEDKREGKGIFTWNNGDKYDGEWRDDKKHGDGILFYSNGNKLVGEFRKGNPWNTTLEK